MTLRRSPALSALFLFGWCVAVPAVADSWNYRTDVAPRWVGNYYAPTSFALDDDLLVLGTPSSHVRPGSVSGAAFVYRKRAPLWWALDEVLTTVDTTRTQFGSRVAVGDDLVAVQSLGRGNSSNGAVHVFRKVGASWSVEAVLEDPAPERNGAFGSRLAISGDTIVATAIPRQPHRGRAYVFRHVEGAWTLEATLEPDPGLYSGFGGDAIALDGDTLAVADTADSRHALLAGMVYVFERGPQGWERRQAIYPTPPLEQSTFGVGVTLEGDTLAIAWPNYGPIWYQRPGAAFVYARDGGNWTLETRLDPPTSWHWFERAVHGRSVHLVGDTLLVGGHVRPPNGFGQLEATHVYRRTNGSWTFESSMHGDAQPHWTPYEEFRYAPGVIAIGPRFRPSDGRRAVSVYESGPQGLNRPPSAEFSLPQVALCSAPSGARVVLDGSASVDPDSTPGTNDDIRTFEWTMELEGGPPSSLGSGETRESYLPLGDLAVRLTVTDGAGFTDVVSRKTSVYDVAKPVGSVTHPENGSCIGAAEVPVALRDDFADLCDPDLERMLDFPRAGWIDSPTPVAGGRFGETLARDGDRMVVGAPAEGFGTGADRGAAHVFRRRDGAWVPEARLSAANARGYFINFGSAVAVRGDRIAVGAPLEDLQASKDGAAYVYRHDGGAWALEQKLGAGRNDWSLQYGASVRFGRDFLAVGAPGLRPAGAVAIWKHDGASWRIATEIVPPTAESVRFGWSLGVVDDRLLVGAPGTLGVPGKVYEYERQGDTWVLRQELGDGGRGFREFGSALAVHGDVLVVRGDPHIHTNPHGNRSALVFRRVAGNWEVDQVLPMATRITEATSVATDGERIAVGNHRNDTVGMNQGAVLLYERDGAGWRQSRRAYSAAANNGWMYLGTAVEIDGERLLVAGAGGQVSGTWNPGRLAIFDLSPRALALDSHGTHRAGLTASDDWGNAAYDGVEFRIDLVPPSARMDFGRAGPIAIPTSFPLSVVLSSSDDDGVEGGVVRERLLLEGCVILDGATFGDGDGLLSDESISIGVEALCEIAARCGFEELRAPELRFEAEDCGGNRGASARVLQGLSFSRARACGGSSMRSTYGGP